MVHFVKTLKTSVLLLLLASLPLLAEESPKKPLVVAYIGQISDGEEGFWTHTLNFLRAAADDLKVKTIVRPANNHIEAYRLFEDLINSKDKPSYIIYPAFFHSGDRILVRAEQEGIYSIIFNSRFRETVKDDIGKPGEKFKYWLAHFYPNDFDAGADLAKILHSLHDEKEPQNQKSLMVAINGNTRRSPGKLRRDGVRHYASTTPNIELKRLVSTEWQEKDAERATETLLSYYPDLDIVWTAGARLADGAIQALEKRSLIPGEDVKIGSIDWSPKNRINIKNSKLNVALGGHFMEAGWAMVLAHDHYYGSHLDNEKRIISLPMAAMTPKNVDELEKIMLSKNWYKMNFRLLSKVFNPKLQAYDFSIENIQNIYRKSDDSVVTKNDSPLTLDSDSDGVFDVNDLCPDSKIRSRISTFGCEILPLKEDFNIFPINKEQSFHYRGAEPFNVEWEYTLKKCQSRDGSICWEYQVPRGLKKSTPWFGMGIYSRIPLDLSNFTNPKAQLSFKIRIPSELNIQIGIVDKEDNAHWVDLPTNAAKYGIRRTGEWEHIKIPIQDMLNPKVDIRSIIYSFALRSRPPFLGDKGFKLYLDDIIWTGAKIQDQDKDGVNDANDQCADTKKSNQSQQIDGRGCLITQ